MIKAADGIFWVTPGPDSSIWWLQSGGATPTLVAKVPLLPGGDSGPALYSNSASLFIFETDKNIERPAPYRFVLTKVDKARGERDVLWDQNLQASGIPIFADDERVFLATVNEIDTISVNGGPLVPLISGIAHFAGFYADESFFYWVDAGSSQTVYENNSITFQLVQDGTINRMSRAGGLSETLAGGLIQPGRLLSFGNDLYFELRRCTAAGSLFPDALASIPKGGGNIHFFPTATEVEGASLEFVDRLHGLSWAGWTPEPSHVVRNYRTSIDGQTVVRLDSPADTRDSAVLVLGFDENVTNAWDMLGDRVVAWPN